MAQKLLQVDKIMMYFDDEDYKLNEYDPNAGYVTLVRRKDSEIVFEAYHAPVIIWHDLENFAPALEFGLVKVTMPVPGK